MASIGSIITKYRKNAGLNQIELAKRLTDAGCPTTNKALSAWERDKAEPSVSTLLHLCLILQIPDIYEEYFGSNPKNPLSTLNDSGKEKVLDYIELLHLRSCYVKERKVIPYVPRRRTLHLYTTSVSAGTGNFLDDGQYEEIEVGEEIPEIAWNRSSSTFRLSGCTVRRHCKMARSASSISTACPTASGWSTSETMPF